MSDAQFSLSGRVSAFVTRDAGRRIRDELLSFELQTAPEDRIVIDATGVDALTPSFVDEFFGRTASTFGIERFRERFQIRGVDPDTKILINNVVRNRLMLDARARG